MFNPDAALVSTYMPSLEAAARSLKVEPIIAHIHSDGEIETAITALGREPGGGLVCLQGGGFTLTHRAPIISAAARNNVPAVYRFSFFARDGGLLSYAPDLVDTVEALNNPTNKIYPLYTRARSRCRPGGPRRAQHACITAV